MMYAVVSQAQRRSSEGVLAKTRVASSGYRVNTPSDDPSAYGRTVARDGRDAVITARRDVALRASNDLDVAEGILGTVADHLTRARELAVQGANGTMTADMRATMAVEVRALRDSVLSLSNTRGGYGYIFAGNRTDTAPFTSAMTFVGNDDARSIDVADGVSVRVNASGAQAFTTAGGVDVFQVLGDLATAMETNNPAGISTSIDALDASHRQVVASQVQTGFTGERIRTAAEVIDNALLASHKVRASDMEADAVTAFSDMTQAQNAYTRSITVTRQLLALSAVQRQ